MKIHSGRDYCTEQYLISSSLPPSLSLSLSLSLTRARYSRRRARARVRETLFHNPAEVDSYVAGAN